jgi:hypothetical protein
MIVVCRALVNLFSDPLLSRAVAFRGGTAQPSSEAGG